MTETTLSVFAGLAILAVLAFDLGVFNKTDRETTTKQAMLWTVFWIAFALAFNVIVYFYIGRTEGVQFLSGYLVEKSLSVDNLFVFLIIFSYFQVPSSYQHKVLFWGIIGAIVLRGVLIYAGIQLIQTYHWLTYIFGLFIVLTGIKTLFKSDEELKLEKNPILRFLRSYLRVTTDYRGAKFLVREEGKLYATPLLVVLIMIETTDVLFALDSIPAILAITTDPFVLYSSNLFAILGLRALYFVLDGLMKKFQYLNYGVSLILIFVGAKMLIAPWLNVPEEVTLSVILFLIVGSSVLSVLHKPQVPASRPAED